MILFVSLLVKQRLDFDRKAEEVDESRRVVLVVNVVLAEGCELLAVECIRRGYACIDDVALVEFEFDVARHSFLS